MKCYQVNGGTCQNLVSPMNNFVCAAGHSRSNRAGNSAVTPKGPTPSLFVDEATEVGSITDLSGRVAEAIAKESITPFFSDGKLPSHWVDVPLVTFSSANSDLREISQKVLSLLQVSPQVMESVKSEIEGFDFEKDQEDPDKIASFMEALLDGLNQIAPDDLLATCKSFGEEASFIYESDK